MFDKKYLVNFGKLFTLFKSVNHFLIKADAVDPLLNDAVDLHVQTVDHNRNPATIAGFRQAIFQHRSKSGQCRNLKIPAGIRQRPATVVGFRQFPAILARFQPFWPEFSTSGEIMASFAGIRHKWPDTGIFYINILCCKQKLIFVN
jgi:hypothetical protein